MYFALLWHFKSLKLCQIEILSENKNSQGETDSSTKTIEKDELHKRLIHTNGVIQGSKNGLISNGNGCQNGTVVSNGDHHTENPLPLGNLAERGNNS
jgi:hypothetical protein